MSKVIYQAKKQYKIALGIELGVLLASLICLLGYQWQVAISFILGSSAIFIPHCLFVWFVFFTKKQQFSNKLTTFYGGEAVKFISTIFLIVLAFKLFNSMHFIAFFVGYFITIVLNNILPFFISKYLNIKHFHKYQ
ncbi:ATP synthase subunit I [Pasteurella multocida]|uniref:F0F1 ATP synthase subunit I n=3 Tax=Pasteurella multocida TaxID=747 RepID=Q9CKW7_PASMU|nr:ATP synthase subunit I [Pasteurella multocida]AAK03571.1 unknown [Pasteurella multocida subsp. multocida str. Pm70]ARA89930.1 F0F1 ATP synthase subunit I [Pasteurella multocida subsp. septica]AUL54021.1 ATP synthase F0F1 subunit I [Pasteurella multocida]AWB55487.1 F0F1 ATP synthase subunit I [Pasteurella multocida]EPE73434.1 F0F1 ATP synthase subunit I [Pasteurella multocida RIIF]